MPSNCLFNAFWHNVGALVITFYMIYEKVVRAYEKYREKKCVIGYSFLGRKIFAFHVGDNLGKQFIATYAIHAREWITCLLALRHLKQDYRVGGWIIPLVNPDGVEIACKYQPLWKANARGVDLNCNFDAEWGTGKLNVKKNGAENCIGQKPFSESETLALKNFTLKIMPFTTLSFHTKGEEIYWEFNGEGDEKGAKILQKITGYTPKIITGSAGGYKDWCINALKIPSYTIECGADCLTHPITKLKHLKKCENALKIFTDLYEKQIYEKRAQMRTTGF